MCIIVPLTSKDFMASLYTTRTQSDRSHVTGKLLKGLLATLTEGAGLIRGAISHDKSSALQQKRQSKPTSTHLCSVICVLGYAHTHMRRQVHSVTSLCFLSWRKEHVFSAVSLSCHPAPQGSSLCLSEERDTSYRRNSFFVGTSDWMFFSVLRVQNHNLTSGDRVTTPSSHVCFPPLAK